MLHLTRALAAFLLLLTVAAGARAQSVQITPFAGYAFGGSVWDAAFEGERSFDPAVAFGGAVNFPIGESWRFELLYSRQATQIEGGLSPSFDVAIERYMGGFQEEKVAAKVVWFGTAWLGATRFVPGLEGYESETRFGAGAGLGLKKFVSKHVGFRLEARAFWTLVNGEGGMACANGNCLFAFSGSGMWQGDVGGGVIFAF